MGKEEESLRKRISAMDERKSDVGLQLGVMMQQQNSLVAFFSASGSRFDDESAYLVSVTTTE